MSYDAVWRISVTLAFGALGLMLGAPASRADAPLVEEPTPIRSFRTFDNRNSPGLPQSTVTSFLQDESGLLWIGTLGGLARFDGQSIELVPAAQGAPRFEGIMALAPRAGGGLYAAGFSGVHVFDGRDWRASGKVMGVERMVTTNDRKLWVLDNVGQVWESRDAVSETWRAVDLLPESGPAVDLSSGPAGDIWIAGSQRVVGHHRSGLFFAAGAAPAPSPITTLLVSKSGACWIGTAVGEVHVSADCRGPWSAALASTGAGGSVRILAEDLRGRIWAAGENGGVIFGRDGGPWSTWGPANGLRSAEVLAIQADAEGSLWFGYNAAGLQQWIGEDWSHRNVWTGQDGAVGMAISSVTSSPAGFVAPVFGRGIWRWTGSSMIQLGAADGLSEDVFSAVEPLPGTIWAGARSGILESRQGGAFRWALSLPEGDRGKITGFHQDPSGIWHARSSTRGVYVHDGESWEPWRLNPLLPSLQVSDIAWMRNGEIWVATEAGLVKISGERAARVELGPAAGMPHAVNDVVEMPWGEIWVAGRGGIGVIDEIDGSRRLLTSADGLPGEFIKLLAVAPDGAVWACGGNGIGRFSAGAWTVFDTTNGLLDRECNLGGLAVLSDGTVMAATMGSLARFDPGVLPVPQPPLRGYWQGLQESAADGLIHLEGRSVRVAWRPSWLGQRPIEYRLRIPEVQDAWSPPRSQTDAYLENLPSGSWTVEVSARAVGAAPTSWSPLLEARFYVRPRWWERTTARIAGSLLAALGLGGFVRLRTRVLRRRGRRLDAEVKRRTAELHESNQHLHKATTELFELSRRDALTGLFNRRAAEEVLRQVLAQARRGSPCGVLMFDIDHFKKVNDTHGHDAGDAVLVDVARCALATLRETETLARIGGEEFLVIYPATSPGAALAAAKRLRAAIAIHPVVLPNGSALTVTISGGVAAAPPHLVTAELLKAADSALYAAKRGGRNRIVAEAQPASPHLAIAS